MSATTHNADSGGTVSVLLTLGDIDGILAEGSTSTSSSSSVDQKALLEKMCTKLGVKPDHVDLFTLVPSTIAGTNAASSSEAARHSVAVRLRSDKMTVDYFKYLISENKRLETKVEKTAEALITLQNSFSRQLTEAGQPGTPPPAPQINLSGPPGASATTPIAVSGGPAIPRMAPLSPRVGSITSNTNNGGMSPREAARLPPQKRLEMANKALAAEVDELRQKLLKSERFKKEVLQTVKDLKQQLAVLTEEILLNEWDMEEDVDSEADA